MAKWKGPFIITKIPNRFQIEYLDDNVTWLTHISYAKKYNERCHYTEPVGIPNRTRVSHRQPRARMARLRLVAGSVRHRIRKVVDSMRVIRELWPVCSGRVRVKVLGERKDLHLYLQAVVKAAGQEGCIEGSVLVDLCVQRSEERGSGCDAPSASEELPLPMENPLPPPTLTAVQVRQYSYRPCAKKNVHDIRQELVGTNIQSNRIFSVLPQQAPLVEKVHLLDVVRKVGRNERLKGKELKEFIIKDLNQNRGKTMTSLLSSRSKAERGKQQIAVISEYSFAERKPYDQISRKTNDMYTLKLSKTRKNKREVKSRHLESTNYDVMINDNALNFDVINLDVNKPIARKRYAQKHSFMSEKEFVKSLLRACSRTVTKITLILVSPHRFTRVACCGSMALTPGNRLALQCS